MRLLRAQMPRRFSNSRYAVGGGSTLVPSVVFSNHANNTAVQGDPSTDPGDLCVVWFGNGNGSVVPTNGSGFTSIDTGDANPTASCTARLSYRVNTSSDQPASGFSSANRGIMVVIRDADASVMNGACQVTGSGGSLNYPALTLTEPCLILIGHMPDDTEEHTWPAGFTQVDASTGLAPRCAVAISDTEQSLSWSGESVSQTGNQLAITFSLAILGA